MKQTLGHFTMHSNGICPVHKQKSSFLHAMAGNEQWMIKKKLFTVVPQLI